MSAPLRSAAFSAPFVQLAHQNPATVGGELRSAEIDLQSRTEEKLKRRILFLTSWVRFSGRGQSHWSPHEKEVEGYYKVPRKRLKRRSEIKPRPPIMEASLKGVDGELEV